MFAKLPVSLREAKNAWFWKSKFLAREIEEDAQGQPRPENRTIDDAIERFLVEVKATKGAATLKAYNRDLRWFRKHCSKHYVSRLFRDDAMALFAAGREQRLNQKTINRHVIVMLSAMRGAGATGQLPRTGHEPGLTDSGADRKHDALRALLSGSQYAHAVAGDQH